MSRVIVGIRLARACDRPKTIPVGRPRKKSKIAGLGYEKALAAALPEALHGQWFEFEDRNGRGHCQPDLILDSKLGLIVLEAKYTWTEAGHRQIDLLYRPVVEKAMGRDVLGIVVCKVLTPEVQSSWVCRDLDSAVRRAFTGGKTVLHWIGNGLGPLQARPAPSHLAEAFPSL